MKQLQATFNRAGCPAMAKMAQSWMIRQRANDCYLSKKQNTTEAGEVMLVQIGPDPYNNERRKRSSATKEACSRLEETNSVNVKDKLGI